MCVQFYVLMPVLERKHREQVGQLPERQQDRYVLGSPKDWIKIITGRRRRRYAGPR